MNLPNIMEVEIVGVIPQGKTDVLVGLRADMDLDIVLFDLDDKRSFSEGRAIVRWCETLDCNLGLMIQPGEETITYKGMNITYSGYYGVGDKAGHEFIRISGTTTASLSVGALSFVAGGADIEYSWSGTDTACCRGTERCTGSFTSFVGFRETKLVGEVPIGKRDLRVELMSASGGDLDIQLFDVGVIERSAFSEGSAVVAYTFCAPASTTCNRGPLGNSPGEDRAVYKEVTYAYSGFNGMEPGQPGKEYIELTGTTNTPLRMLAFGYFPDDAYVAYSWWEVPGVA